MMVISLFVPFAKAQDADISLEISRFKVSTGGQFFELHNKGLGPVAMGNVQLAYYNNYDVSKATSSKMISLSGEMQRGEYYLINDSSMTMCYQSLIASASLGFSTTSGMVQLIYFSQPTVGGPFVSTVLDSVAWSRSAVGGAVQTLPAAAESDAFLQKTDEGWKKYTVDPADPCAYIETVVLPEEYEDFTFLTSELPPVRFVTAVSESKGKVNRNVGKMAPVINEMLPNPASPQTDADDEFIELYNPNESIFDLSGFKLAFGSTNPKRYTFPEGTVLQPHEFKSFTSGDTSISLSNTSAQVWLLDPNEKILHQSEPYNKAKDGQAWALDSTTNTWVWTLEPTPGAMNALTGAAAGVGTDKTAKAVLGISTSDSAAGGALGTAASTAGSLADKTPVHPVVLAVIGAAALAYALYEYRQDISNKLFQLKRHNEHRRKLRQKVSGRGSVSAGK